MPHASAFSRRCPEPLLIVISGPSASGKDTVVQRMKEHGQEFQFVVTATTRERRPGEVHGRDYWFVSKAEFARMVKEGELLEHAMVYGEEKGVPRAQVRDALASGRDVVMRLDVQGRKPYDALYPMPC
jgi:guanylate kinase